MMMNIPSHTSTYRGWTDYKYFILTLADNLNFSTRIRSPAVLNPYFIVRSQERVYFIFHRHVRLSALCVGGCSKKFVHLEVIFLFKSHKVSQSYGASFRHPSCTFGRPHSSLVVVYIGQNKRASGSFIKQPHDSFGSPSPPHSLIHHRSVLQMWRIAWPTLASPIFRPVSPMNRKSLIWQSVVRQLKYTQGLAS